jgi:hypothetical protein
MKYFIILIVLIGFTGFAFAEEVIPLHDPYTDDYRLELASEKKFVSEESMGGGSGMGFFDESTLVQNTVIIAIIAVSSAIVLIYYSKKIKN